MLSDRVSTLSQRRESPRERHARVEREHRARESAEEREERLLRRRAVE